MKKTPARKCPRLLNAGGQLPLIDDVSEGAQAETQISAVQRIIITALRKISV
jgi:hypothetical protein